MQTFGSPGSGDSQELFGSADEEAEGLGAAAEDGLVAGPEATGLGSGEEDAEGLDAAG